MHLYYAIAFCRVWGVDTPQALLPLLSGLSAPMVNALLCAGGQPTGMAREYLNGECGGDWRTDHGIIAEAIVRRIQPGDPLPMVLTHATIGLSAIGTPVAAAFVGSMLYHVAVNPRLVLDDMRGQGVLLGPAGDTGLPPNEVTSGIPPDLQAGLSDPQVVAAIAALRAQATPGRSADLLRPRLPPA